MPKVIVPNLPTRYDAATDKRVPSVDLNPASAYGEIITLTEGSVRYNMMNDAAKKVKDTIAIMNEGDYLVCAGDPILFAAAMHYASFYFKSLKVLRWDKNNLAYDTVEFSL